MDPNLTYPVILNASYPIILNPSINATLTTPSSMVKDWLPAIVSIVVVIVGGFITYFSTTRIEEHKRQYELKRDVYFELLSAISDITKGKGIELENVEDEEIRLKICREMAGLLLLHEMKIDIVANEPIKNIYHRMKDKTYRDKDFEEFLDFYLLLYNEFVPAIREDLSRETRWMFWEKSRLSKNQPTNTDAGDREH